MNISLPDRQNIFAKVCRIVREKHFNPGFRGVNWDELTTQRAGDILRADDAEQFEKQMQKLLADLRTSHTGFFHKSNRSWPARHAISATFKSCAVDGELSWVFQDVHEGGAAHAAGITPGDVLLALNDTRITPPNAVLFRMGEVSIATVRRPNGVSNRIELQVPNPKNRKHPINVPRAVTHQDLPNGIAYLKIAMFPGAIGIDFSKQVSAAMAEFAARDRLIVDLRGNTGGGIGGLRLMSHLTPEKLPIGYSLTRKRAQAGYRREELRRFDRIPSSKAALPWLVLKYALADKSICLYTEGLGPRKFHGRIVLLVNEHTASAAEMLAAFAADNNLAKIVGSTTAGRLLSGSAFQVGHGYVLGVPTAAYLTWEGRSLEGEGITPDVEIDASCDSLLAGTDLQLQQAIRVIADM
jgi:carboxyl-terminal processing protease